MTCSETTVRRRSRSSVAIAGTLLALLASAASARADERAEFEAPPSQAPDAALPAAQVSGTNFHVVDPVRSDGLMFRFVIESKFGRFDAYGRTGLAARVGEIGALTTLDKTSAISVVAGGVGHGVEGQVETAAGVIAHPIKTVTGIPRGISHLFRGYVNQAKEGIADAKGSAASASAANSGKTPSNVAAKGEAGAKRYAARYFGLTSAERHWYEKLGVDPYTDNSVLRDAVHKDAKIDAAAGFGMRFVGVPSIPGIGDIHEVMDAVYHDDPATIRARTKATLAGYGLDPGEIDRWQNSLVLSPTRQLILLNAASSLSKVEGRAELFRHALGLTSDAEAQVYLRSVGLLVLAHSKQPIVRILPGVRLPTGERADGHIVVCGAFDAVYWTADVATGEEQIRQALPPGGTDPREIWLAGAASDRARTELRSRGWELVEDPQTPVADSPAH